MLRSTRKYNCWTVGVTRNNVEIKIMKKKEQKKEKRFTPVKYKQGLSFNESRNFTGFTLIEFLIYMGIVVFVMATLTLSGINIIAGRSSVIMMGEINKNVNFSLGRITYLIRNAESINYAGGNSLSLEMSSPVENPTEIYLEDGSILISRGGYEGRLTTETVEITALNFEEFENNAARIEMTIIFKKPPGKQEDSIERSFQVTETVRK
jgi:hypothetical protein